MQNADPMPAGNENESTGPLLSRDELVALVARAHGASSLEGSAEAGRALAAQSQLPTLVAQNLGAGFGQWDFFPEAGDIVDFALAYARPSTEEDVWKIARTWASDDATARPAACLHWKITGVPVLTSDASRAASQFVNRTHPCDSVWPMLPGSGVPCSGDPAGSVNQSTPSCPTTQSFGAVSPVSAAEATAAPLTCWMLGGTGAASSRRS